MLKVICYTNVKMCKMCVLNDTENFEKANSEKYHVLNLILKLMHIESSSLVLLHMILRTLVDMLELNGMFPMVFRSNLKN